MLPRTPSQSVELAIKRYLIFRLRAEPRTENKKKTTQTGDDASPLYPFTVDRFVMAEGERQWLFCRS